MTRVFIIWLLAQVNALPAVTQAGGGIEQYHYVSASQPYVYMPVMHFQTNRQWYAEARYNYEELKTFSLYVGKTFGNDSRLSYSFTPLLGGVVGRFNGISTGLNMDIAYKQFFFSAQSQYSFATGRQAENFLYSWSEAGYQGTEWFCSGLSLQQTHYAFVPPELDAGVFIGFSFRKWSVPVYLFNPLKKEKYFIVGLTVEWQSGKIREKKSRPAPIVKTEK